MSVKITVVCPKCGHFAYEINLPDDNRLSGNIKCRCRRCKTWFVFPGNDEQTTKQMIKEQELN